MNSRERRAAMAELAAMRPVAIDEPGIRVVGVGPGWVEEEFCELGDNPPPGPGWVAIDVGIPETVWRRRRFGR